MTNHDNLVKLSIGEVQDIVEGVVQCRTKLPVFGRQSKQIFEHLISKKNILKENRPDNKKQQPRMFSQLNGYLDFWQVYAEITNKIKLKLHEKNQNDLVFDNFTPDSNFLLDDSAQEIKQSNYRETISKTQKKIQNFFQEQIKNTFLNEAKNISDVLSKTIVEDRCKGNDDFQSFFWSKLRYQEKCKNVKEKKGFFYNPRISKNIEDNYKLQFKHRFREQLGVYNRVALSMLNVIVERKKRVKPPSNPHKRTIKVSFQQKPVNKVDIDLLNESRCSFNMFNLSSRNPFSELTSTSLNEKSPTTTQRVSHSSRKDSKESWFFAEKRDNNIKSVTSLKRQIKKSSTLQLDKDDFITSQDTISLSKFDKSKLQSKRSLDLFFSVDKSIKCIKQGFQYETKKIKKVNMAQRNAYQNKMQKILKVLEKQDTRNKIKKPVFEQFIAATSKQLDLVAEQNIDEVEEFFEEIKPKIVQLGNQGYNGNGESWVSMKSIKSLKKLKSLNINQVSTCQSISQSSTSRNKIL